MGFMDELKKLTQPYDDEDDFFEGADESAKPAPAVSAAQMEFENTFDSSSTAPEPAVRAPRAEGAGGLFGGRKAFKPKAPQREKTVSFGGNDTQVVLFNPKSFDEAGELVSYLNQARSLVMTLEGVQTENARRLLDFMSGITFALGGRITPISAKTYFITPENVDVVNPQAQAEQPENYGQYF